MRLTFITQHITQAIIIKLMILFFVLSVFAIIILESSPPQIVSINNAQELPISTPLSVIATIENEYISNDFSVLTLQSINNKSASIQAIIQENATIFDINTPYLISGKITTYRGEKQIDIYSVEEYED